MDWQETSKFEVFKLTSLLFRLSEYQNLLVRILSDEVLDVCESRLEVRRKSHNILKLCR